MDSESQPRLSPQEFQSAAHLLLRDLDLHLEPGTAWDYDPSRQAISYIPSTVDRWPWARAMAALSHQSAQARFTGTGGTARIERWLDQVSNNAMGRPQLAALARAVDAMRVDRRQMERYLGVHELMRWLYVISTDPAADEAHGESYADQFVAGLRRRWIRLMWPDATAPSVGEPIVTEALRDATPAVMAAAQHNDIEAMLTALAAHVVPTYEHLARAWEARDDEDVHGLLAPNRRDPGKPIGTTRRAPAPTAVERDKAPDVTQKARARTREPMPAEQAVDPETDDQEPELAEDDTDVRRIGRPRHATHSSQQRPTRAQPGRVSQRGRAIDRGRSPQQISAGSPELPPEPQIDYEAFDYPAAVRRLRPLIQSTLEGDGRRIGLAELMSRRRHGTVDPWRRPRTQRRGDRGEIDPEHPEYLLTDPAQAFVRGVRSPRADRQRDFADAILLDVSGSMVQRGFPTRKFNRLVDSAVIFIEIHERLRIPYSVLSFSTTPVVHWRFDQCTWTVGRVDGPTGLHPHDHSEIFRSMYAQEHRDTNDARALELAISETRSHPGLKSVVVITDGISSDPSELRHLLDDLNRRNHDAPPMEQMRILAFGVGVVREEFEAAYARPSNVKNRRSCLGVVVRDVSELPQLIGHAVAERLRLA